MLNLRHKIASPSSFAAGGVPAILPHVECCFTETTKENILLDTSSLFFSVLGEVYIFEFHHRIEVVFCCILLFKKKKWLVKTCLFLVSFANCYICECLTSMIRRRYTLHLILEAFLHTYNYVRNFMIKFEFTYFYTHMCI